MRNRAERPRSAAISSAGTIVLCGVFASLVWGCSDSPEVAPVHGVVTLDGQPVTGGYVFVTPTEGRMAKGEIQPDGAFTLGTYGKSDGAKVGSHPVTIHPPAAQEWAAPSETDRRVPARYASAQSSGLTVEVRPGVDNELVLTLESP